MQSQIRCEELAQIAPIANPDNGKGKQSLVGEKKNIKHFNPFHCAFLLLFRGSLLQCHFTTVLSFRYSACSYTIKRISSSGKSNQPLLQRKQYCSRGLRPCQALYADLGPGALKLGFPVRLRTCQPTDRPMDRPTDARFGLRKMASPQLPILSVRSGRGQTLFVPINL